MIFIYWHIFILIEVALHSFIIDVIHYDITPDRKLLTWSKIGVIALRVAVFFGLWWTYGIKHDPEFWFYFSGAMASHLLWFPILLNLVRRKPIDYLGKGPVDKFLKLAPPIFRWWCLAVIIAAAIYGYFNTDLL